MEKHNFSGTQSVRDIIDKMNFLPENIKPEIVQQVISRFDRKILESEQTRDLIREVNSCFDDLYWPSENFYIVEDNYSVFWKNFFGFARCSPEFISSALNPSQITA